MYVMCRENGLQTTRMTNDEQGVMISRNLKDNSSFLTDIQEFCSQITNLASIRLTTALQHTRTGLNVIYSNVREPVNWSRLNAVSEKGKATSINLH